jgi:hypothetical protein
MFRICRASMKNSFTLHRDNVTQTSKRTGNIEVEQACSPWCRGETQAKLTHCLGGGGKYGNRCKDFKSLVDPRNLASSLQPEYLAAHRILTFCGKNICHSQDL